MLRITAHDGKWYNPLTSVKNKKYLVELWWAQRHQNKINAVGPSQSWSSFPLWARDTRKSKTKTRFISLLGEWLNDWQSSNEEQHCKTSSQIIFPLYICRCRITANTSAFQAEDEGSTPSTCSTPFMGASPSFHFERPMPQHKRKKYW